MGTEQNYNDRTGGGEQSTNPGMSGDYTPEEFKVPQTPTPTESDSLTKKVEDSPVGMSEEKAEESMIGVDENPLGTEIQKQTTPFKDTGVQGPQSPRPAKL
jgi:hypothetical protein